MAKHPAPKDKLERMAIRAWADSLSNDVLATKLSHVADRVTSHSSEERRALLETAASRLRWPDQYSRHAHQGQ